MTEPVDASPSASDSDVVGPAVSPSSPTSYVSMQWTSDRPSLSPEGLTPEEQKHQRETSLVMSIVVIVAVVLGTVPLLYLSVVVLFAPVLLIPWLVVPTLLTVLAATALRRAKRGGSRGPRVTARWALGGAIATFGLPLVAIAYFAAAMS